MPDGKISLQDLKALVSRLEAADPDMRVSVDIRTETRDRNRFAAHQSAMEDPVVCRQGVSFSSRQF